MGKFFEKVFDIFIIAGYTLAILGTAWLMINTVTYWSGSLPQRAEANFLAFYSALLIAAITTLTKWVTFFGDGLARVLTKYNRGANGKRREDC